MRASLLKASVQMSSLHEVDATFEVLMEQPLKQWSAGSSNSQVRHTWQGFIAYMHVNADLQTCNTHTWHGIHTIGLNMLMCVCMWAYNKL